MMINSIPSLNMPENSVTTVTTTTTNENGVMKVTGHSTLVTPTPVGVKHDSEKPRMDLLSPIALEELAKVLTFGAKKYAPYNWAKGIAYSRILGAMLRHLLAFSRGQDKDPETGLSHIAHLMCNCQFLLHFEKYRTEFDDRPKDIYDSSKK